MEPRDVIARAMVDQEAPAGAWNGYVASYPVNQVKADAIITALDQAGYEITKRTVAENATVGPEYVVTDAMLEAAGETMYEHNWENVRKFSWITGPMRAGIEAAERVRRANP